MRKTIIVAKSDVNFYTISQFPIISPSTVASQLEKPCMQTLNEVFDSYIEKIETSLGTKTKSKALAQIERIRKSTLKKFKKIIDAYASDISQINPKGFS